MYDKGIFPYEPGEHRFVFLLFNETGIPVSKELWASHFISRNVTNLFQSVLSLGLSSIVGKIEFTSTLEPRPKHISSWYYYDRFNYQPDLKRTLISDRDRIAMVSVLLVSSSLAMGFFGKSTSDTGTAAVCFQILLFAFAFLALISAVVEALLLNKQSQSLTYANYMTLTKCDCFPSWLFLVLTLLVLPCAFGLRFIADTYHDDDDDDNDDPSKHRRKFEVAFVIVAMSLTSLIMILKLWLLSIGNTVS
jgi:hypothetical protein